MVHPVPKHSGSRPGHGGREKASASVAFASEAALVAGVRAGNPTAMAELHDRFGASTLRIVARILGPDRELADVHHDVFVRALQSIHELRDPQALHRWMSSVAVHTARASIERRARRRRWLFFLPIDRLPELETDGLGADDDTLEALRATYAVLDRMPVDERIVFVLRYVEGMELAEVALASKVSLASVKRRIARAEARFSALASRAPALRAYVGGSRWTRP